MALDQEFELASSRREEDLSRHVFRRVHEIALHDPEPGSPLWRLGKDGVMDCAKAFWDTAASYHRALGKIMRSLEARAEAGEVLEHCRMVHGEMEAFRALRPRTLATIRDGSLHEAIGTLHDIRRFCNVFREEMDVVNAACDALDMRRSGGMTMH